MNRILITGATGNIGSAIFSHLNMASGDVVKAGVRNPAEASFPKNVQPVPFDFHDLTSIREAIQHVEVIFLLRPPQIADVNGVFKPMIELFAKENVQHIVFLSVQGVEKQSFIPHHKIEKLIVDSGIPYTFLRPSYFMQNLTTTLTPEIQNENRLYIPAGQVKFCWIDADDIGRVAALVLENPGAYHHEKYTLTGDDILSFPQVTEKINQLTGSNLRYASPNLLSFFLKKKKDGMKPGMIFVMIMLHWFQRFGKEPERTDTYTKITGRESTSIEDFIERNNEFFR